MKQSKQLQVALAFVQDGQRGLFLQRKSNYPQWNKKWEFPGGKVKKGEGIVEAAIRELHEETGLKAHAGSYLAKHVHTWKLPMKEIVVELHLVACTVERIDTIVVEEEKVYQAKWIKLTECSNYSFLEPNTYFIQKLISLYVHDTSR